MIDCPKCGADTTWCVDNKGNRHRVDAEKAEGENMPQELYLVESDKSCKEYVRLPLLPFDVKDHVCKVVSREV